MKLLVSYVIQGKQQHSYNSELLEIQLTPPLYSPEPIQSDVEKEIVKWIQQKQCNLTGGERIVVLKTLRTD